MLDTLITGGRVVTPAGAGDWDVGIIGEKIAVVAVRGILSATPRLTSSLVRGS
jgi:hypothetical protein